MERECRKSAYTIKSSNEMISELKEENTRLKEVESNLVASLKEKVKVLENEKKIPKRHVFV